MEETERAHRDKLLLARTEELQREYENLVRSLDAAYEAVKSLNQALAENRLESKKIFEERLALASPRLSAVTVPKNGQLQLAKISDGVNNGDNIIERDSRQVVNGKFGGNIRVNKEVTSANQKAAQAQYDGAQNRGDNNEDEPQICFSRTGSDVQAYHQPGKQQTPSARPSVYVGDEHSYAVHEVGESEDSESLSSDGSHPARQLLLEEKLAQARGGGGGGCGGCGGSDNGDGRKVCSLPPGAATAIPMPWRAVWLQEPRVQASEKARAEDSSDVDLSIVKTEWPEDSNETSNPLSEQAPAIGGKVPALPRKRLQRTFPQKQPVRRMRSRKHESPSEAELLRKRKQTRERMRRWRAKKKMEQQLTSCVD